MTDKTGEMTRSLASEGDASDVPKIAQQESVLVFESFEETAAFKLGCALSSIAVREQAGIVIDIRLWDRQLFYAALPTSTASNGELARRKLNVVKLFHKSSYLLALQQQREDRTFPPGYGLDPQDFVLAGGAFPIRVKGVGVIGAIAVSGLSQRSDHNLAVAGLCEHLGKDANLLSLGPETWN
ncbi:heme-degrading domain-containing protein [Mesorhizobium sp.]|uniref:heme-degrading domain-containing protein n=1 Tax=Mesorhizobium sp. TaxID=1871066 RepID=UPI0025F3D55B|nr:heme-degrading domain-containing protein [Mesorhizobium sp.]